MRGFTPDAAAARLLLARRRPAGELSFRRGTADSPEDLHADLLAQGLIARLARLDSPDRLALLALPTLVQLRDDGWVVVHERMWGGFRVEAADGFHSSSAAALAERASGLAFDITPNLRLPGHLLRAVAAMAVADRKGLAAIATATAVFQILALLPPQLTRLALDRALPAGAGSLLNAITLCLVFGGLFQAWTGWLRQRAVLHLRVRLQVVAERGFFDHLLRLPFPAVTGRSRSDLMQAVAGLAEARNVVTDRVIALALDGLMSALYLAAMVATMPGPAGAVVLAGLVMASCSLWSGRKQAALQRQEVQAQVRQRGFLLESLAGIATVKAMGVEKPVLRHWIPLMLAQLGASLRRQQTSLWANVGIELLRQGTMVAVMVWGAYLAIQQATTIGTFVAFVQMSGAFLNGLGGLASGIGVLMILRPQLAKAAELARVDAPRMRPIRLRSAGPIACDDVWFRYRPDAPWVLTGYQLRVEEGEKRWLRGPSGWGKTTALRLMAGLYTPERGTLRIAGLDPAKTRGLLLYLPQFVHLYSGSIYENLRVLSAYAPRARLLDAAEGSGLADFLRTLPMGYDTRLDPRAGTLSGGQRQLIALTAAMAADRPVLLLDEAFVNLDWLSRSWLLDSPWFAGKTVVYASHDAQFAAT